MTSINLLLTHTLQFLFIGLLSVTSAFSQIKNYYAWEIKSTSLADGKLVIDQGQKKEIKFTVTVQRFLKAGGAPGEWENVNFSFQLYRQPPDEGTSYLTAITQPITSKETITSSDFADNQSFFTKEYSYSIYSYGYNGDFNRYNYLQDNDRVVLIVANEIFPVSKVYDIVINTPIKGNTISGDQKFLQFGNPLPLIGSTPEGGTGTYTYQWQSSTNNNLWLNIPGATSKDYDPPASTKTTYSPTYYRRIATAGASSLSNKVRVVFWGVSSEITLIDPYFPDERFIAPDGSHTFSVCQTITVYGGSFSLQTPTVNIQAGQRILLKAGTHLFPNTNLFIRNVCSTEGSRQAAPNSEALATTVVENPSVQSQIKPNPFTDTFEIQLQEKSLKSQIVVMALDGRVVYNTHTENKPVVSFDGRHLPAGLYLVRVIPDNGKEEQFKLLKQ